MTVLEVIRSYPVLDDCNTNLITKVCLDRNLTSGDSYASGLRQSVELAVADLYVEMANSPDFSEGQLSIKYPRESLLKRAEAIYRKYNDPAISQIRKSAVRNGSQFW
jgi:hypothetical protein